MDLKESCCKHALKNAFDYNIASAKFVVGKVLGEVPEAKADMKATMTAVKEAVDRANALSKEEVAKAVKAYSFEKKAQREGLPDSPVSVANTRIAPNPSGMLHIGHARAIVINDEYARLTSGKFLVRLEDTDPKTKKPLPEAYERIPKDIEWLECKIDSIVIQSDRLQLYYDYAEQLINKGKAFVCDCPIEKMRELRADGKPCPCRDLPASEQLARWKKMFGEYGEGGAILRIKTDYAHSNASVRDWPAFRIVTGEHPHEPKARVWPLYNFACAIDDHLLGITLVIRGKEHELNQVKQAFIYDYFGWEQPAFLEYGLIKVPGLLSHKSEILQGICAKRFSGWGDIRLPTLAALRRRGIQARAIRDYMLSLGVKRVDSQLDWKKLYNHNKKLIDAKTMRRFFVPDPVKISLPSGLPKEVRIANHPKEDLGERVIFVTKEIFVSRKDFEGLKGKTVRLKDLRNVVLGEECKDAGNEIVQRMPKIQWVPANAVKARVLKADGGIVEGLAEPSTADDFRVGEVVQFERFGYCCLDSPGEYWYAHN
jgi:glutamyl-tRNA synthetase